MARKKTDAKPMTKTEFVGAVAERTGNSRTAVKAVLEQINEVAYDALKQSGTFTLPGFAKFSVVRKPARKARQGINPFTKEPTTFAAKPASKAVRARPLKQIKDAVG